MTKTPSYSTNFGVCFVIQNKSRELIYASSDYDSVKSNIFIESDSEMTIGRQLLINDIRYEIIKVSMWSNPELIVDMDGLSGNQNKYSYKLTFTVKEVDV